ncbi:MAG TPA: cyclodeaminase/cyclohydrolase family protein [Solirubrobacteraceae bacterium]|nr:cyclodeaminase/cyclohydrolase family protein [Solirubrobacteraceae bacterium]
MDAPLAGLPLGEVLERVAARTPAPGAGSSSALTAALAAALAEMAARFDRSADAAARVARAQALRARSLELAERELHAYEPVLEALALDRSDPSRSARLASARAAAAASPLAIARTASEVATLAAQCAGHGSPHLLGEALAAARLAAGACRAATELVQINLRDDPADPRLGEAATLARAAEAALQEVATPHSSAEQP